MPQAHFSIVPWIVGLTFDLKPLHVAKLEPKLEVQQLECQAHCCSGSASAPVLCDTRAVTTKARSGQQACLGQLAPTSPRKFRRRPQPATDLHRMLALAGQDAQLSMFKSLDFTPSHGPLSISCGHSREDSDRLVRLHSLSGWRIAKNRSPSRIWNLYDASETQADENHKRYDSHYNEINSLAEGFCLCGHLPLQNGHKLRHKWRHL